LASKLATLEFEDAIGRLDFAFANLAGSLGEVEGPGAAAIAFDLEEEHGVDVGQAGGVRSFS